MINLHENMALGQDRITIPGSAIGFTTDYATGPGKGAIYLVRLNSCV